MYPNQRQITEVTLILATYDKFRDKANIIKFHKSIKNAPIYVIQPQPKYKHEKASFMSLLVTEIHA